MPLYEFICKECGNTTEIIKKVGGGEICKECGTVMARVINAPSFVLKGGGWATEGYGKE